MIRELTKLSWERVDVSFRGTLQRFLAHNTIQASFHHHRIIIFSGDVIIITIPIYTFLLKFWKTLQVKTKMINSAGADVIQHMIDNFEP